VKESARHWAIGNGERQESAKGRIITLFFVARIYALPCANPVALDPSMGVLSR
jgi:hypothetical protein